MNPRSNNVVVIPAHRIAEADARVFAREIRDRHVHDEAGFCRWDGMAHPCPDREAADELLYGKAAS
jgi:hypothetical protein